MVKEQIVTPWKVSCDEETGVDYDKIINKFGCTPIDTELINQIESVSQMEAHSLIKRKLVFAHRD
ncbi:hypothetical protein H311_00237, partial [Anncaliia algerae PRA109]